MDFIINKPLISIIITTKNEEANIGNCLKSILRQSYFCDRMEIIVVDNYSTDRTKEIIMSFCHSRAGGNPVPTSIRFFSRGPERSAQRNFGVEKSKGDYFLYLDADMVLSKNVIRECVEKMTRNFELTNCHPEFISGFSSTKISNLIAFYIPEVIMGKGFWCKVRRFERSFYDGTVIDCARFIKKDKFLEVGGFDESMSGPEDWDLDKKLKNIGKVELIKTPIYHNEAEFNLKKYLNKKAYYAKSFDKYIAKWGKDDPDIKKQLGFYYRFIGVFIEKGKWKKTIRHPVLTFGMFTLRFFVGLNYITRNK